MGMLALMASNNMLNSALQISQGQKEYNVIQTCPVYMNLKDHDLINLVEFQ